MKTLLSFFLIFSLTLAACGSVAGSFLSKKTPHEKYAESIEDSPAGQAWIAASKQALADPKAIKLPYKKLNSFNPSVSVSTGFQFTVKRGQRIRFEIADKTPGHTLYADLFRIEGTGQFHEYSAEATVSIFFFEVEDAGTYVLRMQPELNKATAFKLNVEAGPSLGFPVAGAKARTGSFWGDSRDAGKRSHEGIDIFAPKLTPAIAAADGYVTNVGDGGIGGKTVWLRVNDKNISLYYAHLDKQLVEPGQFVKKGDVVGLIGNTGNAKHTPAHLHFGIYTQQGAVDPYPFVK